LRRLLSVKKITYEENIMIIAEMASQTTTTVTQTGISLGSALAIVGSWQRNRSILWAILAGLFSWIYVIYFALTRKPDEVK
jgi:hypothetical protein